MERFREQKKDLYLIFIDLEKAYDKILRNIMWWSLDKYKVPSKYMVQCSGWLIGIGVYISIHSAMKSPSAYDLIMWQGLKSMV